MASPVAVASSADEAARLPPGQYAEPGLPGAHGRPDAPRRQRATGSFASTAWSATAREWTWEEFHELPFETIPCDIHCVTKWSKLGTSFGGVSVDVLLDGVEPKGGYTIVYSYGGYTTNLRSTTSPAARRGSSPSYEGEPLPREHGGPARLLVPHLYFWKSAKWVAGVRVMDHDEPGFWEAQRLPQPRRPVEGAAVLERTDAGPQQRARAHWQIGTVTQIRPRRRR